MKTPITEDKYVICHNGSDTIHASKVQAGTTVATGQPYYEEFDTEDEWKARLVELGADPNKYDRTRPEAPGKERLSKLLKSRAT